MSASFPTTLKDFEEISCPSSVRPADRINEIQLEIESMQAVLGVTSSAITTSHAYKLSGVTSSDKAMSLTGVETATNKTFTLPKLNDNVTLTASSTELNILDGATLSTAELNLLDGVTANTTELNYVDTVVGIGVASKAAILDANKDFDFDTGDITATDASFDFLGIGQVAEATARLSVLSATASDQGMSIVLTGGQSSGNWNVLAINANANTSNQNLIVWEFDSISQAAGAAIGATRPSATATDLVMSITTSDARVEALRLVGTSNGRADFNSDSIRIITAKTPATAAATGTQGQVCWDSSFLYVCTATNTWKRVAIATW